MEYGRVDFVQEVKEKEINKYNQHRLTKSDKKAHVIRGEIEDFKTARDLNITVAELNQVRMCQ